MPVRIRITDVPAGVPLVSGMTATVTIRGDEARKSGGGLGDGVPGDLVLVDRFASLADRLGNIVYGPQPSPGCVPKIGDENGATIILPTPKPVAPLDPESSTPASPLASTSHPKCRFRATPATEFQNEQPIAHSQ